MPKSISTELQFKSTAKTIVFDAEKTIKGDIIFDEFDAEDDDVDDILKKQFQFATICFHQFISDFKALKDSNFHFSTQQLVSLKSNNDLCIRNSVFRI
jgi:hypothetical protein